MAKSFLTDINLNKNVLLNAKIQAWGTTPTGTTLPDGTGTAVQGQISSYAGALYIYNGTAWAAVGTGTVTSVSGTTNQISSTGGATPQLSLATAFGDTVNPYASKTANYVLAAPNGTAGIPSFRALVAADIPSLSATYQAVDGDLTAISAITGTGWLQRTATDTWSVGTPPNYYPTVVTMTAGTTAGPLVGLTMNTGTVTSTAIPAAASGASGIITTGAQTIDGVKTFSSFPEVAGTPTTSNQLVNKTYVDTIATGINAHEAVAYASTAEITGTYSNGVSGVGASLAGTGSLVIDGYTVVSGDAGTNVQGGTGLRVLLKNQTTNTDQNGIYTVTACVSTTSWTLTRAYDYDALGEVAAGDFTYVLLGSANAKFTFVQTSKPAAISGVGTTANAITFGVFANGNISGTVAVNQGGTGATTFTSGALLKGNGTGAISEASAADIVTAISTNAVTNATNATNTNVTETTASSTYYPVFSPSTTTGQKALLQNSVTLPLSYQPSTGTLTTTVLSATTISTTGSASMSVASSGTLTLSGSAVNGNGFSVNVNAGNTTSTTTGLGGTVNVRGGSATGAGSTATGGNVNILAGTATVGTLATTGGNVAITAGDANTTAGTGGAVTILAGNGLTKGAINIGTSNTASIGIGWGTITTTITGAVALPTVGTSGFVKLGASGALSSATIAYTDLPTASLTGVTTDGIARKKTGLLTANSSTTAFAIAHGFGQWVTAQLFDTSGNLVEVDVSNAATGSPAGTTTFTFATAPTTGTNYQYVIIG